MHKSQDDTMGSVELPDFPEIITRSSAISTKCENGSEVSFYIFPEFEIHTNVMPPKTIQDWHYHKQVEEIIFVTSGEVNLFWIDESSQEVEKTLRSGDLCRLGRAKHTIANNSDSEARFMVYKLVPTGQNKHQVIKTDRYSIIK